MILHILVSNKEIEVQSDYSFKIPLIDIVIDERVFGSIYYNSDIDAFRVNFIDETEETVTTEEELYSLIRKVF